MVLDLLLTPVQQWRSIKLRNLKAEIRLYSSRQANNHKYETIQNHTGYDLYFANIISTLASVKL